MINVKGHIMACIFPDNMRPCKYNATVHRYRGVFAVTGEKSDFQAVIEG